MKLLLKDSYKQFLYKNVETSRVVLLRVIKNDRGLACLQLTGWIELQVGECTRKRGDAKMVFWEEEGLGVKALVVGWAWSSKKKSLKVAHLGLCAVYEVSENGPV